MAGRRIRPTGNMKTRSRGFMPLCGRTTRPGGAVKAPLREKKNDCRFEMSTKTFGKKWVE